VNEKAFIIFLVDILIGFYLAINISEDGVSGCRKLFFQDTTTFAGKYSEAKFQLIEKGMDLNKVLELLGEPLFVAEIGRGVQRLSYTRSLVDSHYSVRNLYIVNGIVSRKKAYFHID
jgi:hypothetical protein